MINGRKSIWAVDDNQADLDILQIVLNDGLTDLRMFIEPREAIDELIVATADALPDLLILDVNMPGLSGVEFMRLVRCEPRLSNLRVYVLTGAQLPTETNVMQQLGAQSVLFKPLDYAGIQNLRTKVKAALDCTVPAAQSTLANQAQ